MTGELTTFRLPDRIDRIEPGGVLPVEPIGDHRRAYLTYEGDIGHGRGRVERVAEGRIDAVQSLGRQSGFLIRWTRRAGEERGRVQWLVVAPATAGGFAVRDIPG